MSVEMNRCWRFLLVVTVTFLAYVPPAQATDIVAHRGASHDAPENTLAAFQLAWKKNADAIEGDFLLTSDQHVICLHDKDTKRVAGRKLVAKSTPLKSLQDLDVGSWKAAKYQGERIPTLAQVLKVVPQDKYILIEVKCGPEIIPALTQKLRTSGLRPKQVRIIAFDDKVIAEAKRVLPKVRAFWLTSFKQDKRTRDWTPSLQTVLTTAKRIHADGVDVKAVDAVVNQAFVKGVHDAGLECHVWTINELEQARRYHALGVDSITTDRPQFLRSAITD